MKNSNSSRSGTKQQGRKKAEKGKIAISPREELSHKLEDWELQEYPTQNELLAPTRESQSELDRLFIKAGETGTDQKREAAKEAPKNILQMAINACAYLDDLLRTDEGLLVEALGDVTHVPALISFTPGDMYEYDAVIERLKKLPIGVTTGRAIGPLARWKTKHERAKDSGEHDTEQAGRLAFLVFKAAIALRAGGGVESTRLSTD